MQNQALQTIEHTAAASQEGRISFGGVVAALAEVGVEAYHADYRGETTTYFAGDDTVHRVALPAPRAPTVPIAAAFDAQALQAAIRGAQRGEVKYLEFLRLSRAAGCVGYTVWLRGRHVCYFGRLGEQHIERFPS